MENNREEIEFWLDLLVSNKEVSIELEGDIGNSWLACYSEDEKKWDYEILSHILLLVLERSTIRGFDGKALIILVEVAEKLGKKKMYPSEQVFVNRLAQHFFKISTDAVKNKDWKSASMMTGYRTRIPVPLTLAEKMLIAYVWENYYHHGYAKKYYYQALFHRKPNEACICYTVYTLFLCFLLLKNWKNTTFILGDCIPQNVVAQLITNDVAGIYYRKWAKMTDEFCDILRSYGSWAKENNVKFIGQDQCQESVFFLDENFTVVEDGIANYRPTSSYVIMQNGDMHYVYGNGEIVRKIYLTERLKVPEIVRDKVKKINVEQLWKAKTLEEQNEILSIFSVPLEKIENEINKGRTCILLTQLLYKDYDEEKKNKQVSIYRAIIKEYNMKRIIIKVHQADPINYEKYFPECYILKEQFPIEILKLVGWESKISKIIAVSSTALYGFFDKDKVVSCMDLYERMYPDDENMLRLKNVLSQLQENGNENFSNNTSTWRLKGDS